MVIGIESFKELFTRRLDVITLPQDTVLTPLPMDDDISSLSAILLDDAYYELLRSGRVGVDGITVLDAAYLIPFKVKAWLDLTIRKANGERIDSKNIRKHKNDVFRLSALLGKNTKVTVNQAVWEDMQAFIESMENETVDLKQLGIVRTKEAVLSSFRTIYVLK